MREAIEEIVGFEQDLYFDLNLSRARFSSPNSIRLDMEGYPSDARRLIMEWLDTNG